MSGLLRVQGRPATAYDDQGLVFSIASGGYIRLFDTRKYEKGPFEIYSVGGDFSDANVVKFSNDRRLMLLTTTNGFIRVLDSFRGTLLCSFNVKPVSTNSTLEASFSPEGMFVISALSCLVLCQMIICLFGVPPFLGQMKLLGKREIICRCSKEQEVQCIKSKSSPCERVQEVLEYLPSSSTSISRDTNTWF